MQIGIQTSIRPQEGMLTMIHSDQRDELQSKLAMSIDLHVGRRVRELRIMKGLSQQQLALLIGVTYQQAHKYERGVNRISAGRLFHIAQALVVEPSWFFKGLEKHVEPHDLSPRQRLCLEMARNFSLIKDEKQQEALNQIARSLAVQSDAEQGG
jgi:transcriptional regulator with XRE-family HTH domain